MKQIIGQQGEVVIIKIDTLPKDMETIVVESTNRGFILSHSENGHHHLLTGGDVMERTDNIPSGMKKFYAILKNPEKVIQDSPTPHESFKLDPGIYEFRVSREFDAFSEQARRVVD